MGPATSVLSTGRGKPSVCAGSSSGGGERHKWTLKSVSWAGRRSLSYDLDPGATSNDDSFVYYPGPSSRFLPPFYADSGYERGVTLSVVFDVMHFAAGGDLQRLEDELRDCYRHVLEVWQGYSCSDLGSGPWPTSSLAYSVSKSASPGNGTLVEFRANNQMGAVCRENFNRVRDAARVGCVGQASAGAGDGLFALLDVKNVISSPDLLLRMDMEMSSDDFGGRPLLTVGVGMASAPAPSSAGSVLGLGSFFGLDPDDDRGLRACQGCNGTFVNALVTDVYEKLGVVKGRVRDVDGNWNKIV